MNLRRWSYSLAAVLAVGALGFLAWLRLEAKTADRRPAATPPPISVRTAIAVRGTVQSWVFAEGTARSVRREYLTFQNAGRVTFVKDGPDGEDLREGTPVVAGELLARQDPRSLQADVDSAAATVEENKTQVTVAEAELTRARTEQGLATKTLERFSILLEQASASQQEYDEANAKAELAAAAVAQATSRLAAAAAKVTTALAREKQANLALAETELRAPIDGIVAYVNVKEGYYFTPGMVRTDDETAALQTVPLVVIDPTVFEVAVNVPSFVRDGVRPGLDAMIAVQPEAVAALAAGQPAAAGDDMVRATVFSVNPSVSPGGRTIQVKVRVTDAKRQLKDGLFVSVWLASARRDDAVLVPVQAMLYEDNQPQVFIVRDGAVERRSVTLGLQEFNTQEVTAGVAVGDVVVTEGRFQVSTGARVRAIDSNGSGK